MILLADSEGPDQTAEMQTDLGLRCPHMLEDTFSHGAVHVEKFYTFTWHDTEVADQYVGNTLSWILQWVSCVYFHVRAVLLKKSNCILWEKIVPMFQGIE